MSIDSDSECISKKSELRHKMKSLRLQIPTEQKKSYEDKIYKSIISLDLYKTSDLILTYVSHTNEIDTLRIIENALSSGKRVAVPKCTINCSQMEFYYIDSINDLNCGYMDILEPINSAIKVIDFSGSICLVPALCFDKYGNRLGYGKGFYDRFLKDYCGTSIGLCFNSFIYDELPHNKFDIPVKIILTQDKVIII